MTQSQLIEKALSKAGYIDTDPTTENLIECYLDYADAYGGDIDDLREDIQDGSLTIREMCVALIRCN